MRTFQRKLSLYYFNRGKYMKNSNGNKNIELKENRNSRFLTAVLLLLGILLLPASVAFAALPTAGTLNSTGPNVNWSGTQTGPAAPNGEADCGVIAGACDEFILTLGGTVGDWTNKRARVQINWLAPATDYDMYIYKDSVTSGAAVGTSAAGTTTFEQVDLNPASTGVGVYVVRVVYFAATPADQYSGIASAVTVPPAFVPPASTCIMPQFTRFNPPADMSGYNSAGEPSVGVNHLSGNVLFQSYLDVLRATFDDQTSPATEIWASKRPLNAQTSLDPIMATDSQTGRTISGQLLAAGGSSSTAITDDDGETFTPNVTTGITSGADHQTIGGGPYKPNVPGTGPQTPYLNAWYYASQSVGAATASRSDTGGLSYQPAVPMYDITQCSGLHGHVKVAPDGTVYVPNKNCPDPDRNPATLDGGQGFAVSEDNGTSWTVRTLPGSGSGDNDPAVGIGANGRIFFVYTASDKHIRAAVSDDKGVTWKYDQDLGLSTNTPSGQPYNIKASVFPAAVAGDNDRAAVFFHGTDSTAPGDPTGDDAGTPFAGTWYPYIATTCNQGMSWSVVRADDAVQQGVVCTSGTTCPSGTRNLLDFMDIQVDKQGRVDAGYADGCTTPACLAAVNGTKDVNSKTEVATILRHYGGSRLFAQFDPIVVGPPQLPPPVKFFTGPKGIYFNWDIPYDNGSPLTAYKVYRGYGNQQPSFVTQLDPSVRTFNDRRIKGGRGPVYYQVTAVNALGESPRTRKFSPPAAPFARGNPSAAASSD